MCGIVDKRGITSLQINLSRNQHSLDFIYAIVPVNDCTTAKKQVEFY